MLYVRPWNTLASLYQTIVHELAHALTLEEDVDHGPEFRSMRRQLMLARWPGLSWETIDLPGKMYAYTEDQLMEKALVTRYPGLATTHLRYEVTAQTTLQPRRRR